MSQPKNILIFPGGSEIALEIRNALALEKSVSLFGASGDRFDSGAFLYAHYDSSVPKITDPEHCIEQLNRLVDEWNIDFIFPAHDDIGLFLSQNRGRINCTLLLPE